MTDYENGIDYDLDACLTYNPQGFGVDDIQTVLAVWEGERDEDDWRWVLHLKDGRYMFLQGGCDYTGWDCQSNAVSQEIATPMDAPDLAFQWTESYKGNGEEVRASIATQLAEGKKQTWSEQMHRELGPEPRLP